MKHFPITRTSLAVHEHAERGITVRASQAPTHMHILLHNGSKGNVKSVLSNEEAIDLALEILKVARRK